MDRPRRRVCLTFFIENLLRGHAQLANIKKHIGRPLSYPSFSIRNIADFSYDFEKKVDEWIPPEKSETLNELMFLAWMYKN